MKTLLSSILTGNYGIFRDEGEAGAGGDGGAGGGEGGEGGGSGLPPKDGGGEGGGTGLPPKGEGGTGDPPEIKTYDFEADTSGLKAVDMKGEKILGKFDGVESLVKSYGELEGKISQKAEDFIKEAGYTVPEKYEFGDAGKEWDEETSTAVSAAFKDMALTQDQAVKAIPHMTEIAQELANSLGTQELMDAWGLTGEAFKAKEASVAKWAGQFIPDAIYESLEKLGAEGMLVAESMMRSNQERPLWSGASTNEDLADIQQKITDVEAKMLVLDQGSTEYQALEKTRKALFAKKNPPKA